MKQSTLKSIKRFLIRSFIIFNILSIIWVVCLKFFPVPYTLTMLSRTITNKESIKYQWVDYEEINPNVPLAVVASEDQLFIEHHGFDFKQMKKALKKNTEAGQIKRGGSTISQQVAKNVFLWQHQSYFRKGLEAYYTVLIELLWSKKRILEVYMNVCETGIGTFGMEAGAQRYYHKSAKNLTEREAAEIVSVLPNPIKRNIGTSRANKIIKQMHNLGRNYLAPIESK